MTDTFTWPVHNTASGKVRHRIARAQFGDGYKQEAPIGINTKLQDWNVTVEGYRTEIEAVRDFLDDHVGVAFFWTPPLGVEGYYTCNEYEPRMLGGGLWTISMTFEQGYKP